MSSYGSIGFIFIWVFLCNLGCAFATASAADFGGISPSIVAAVPAPASNTSVDTTCRDLQYLFQFGSSIERELFFSSMSLTRAISVFNCCNHLGTQVCTETCPVFNSPEVFSKFEAKCSATTPPGRRIMGSSAQRYVTALDTRGDNHNLNIQSRNLTFPNLFISCLPLTCTPADYQSYIANLTKEIVNEDDGVAYGAKVGWEYRSCGKDDFVVANEIVESFTLLVDGVTYRSAFECSFDKANDATSGDTTTTIIIIVSIIVGLVCISIGYTVWLVRDELAKEQLQKQMSEPLLIPMI